MTTPLRGNYSWDSAKGLVSNPHGDVTETIRALAAALLKPDGKGEIREYMITLCLKGGNENNPIARHFLHCMTRCKNVDAKFTLGYQEPLEEYLKLYNEAPEELQTLLPRLNEKYFDTFTFNILEEMHARLKDPWLIPCMKALEKATDPNKLFAWYQVVRASSFDQALYRHVALLKELPDEWMRRELGRLPQFQGVTLPPKVAELKYNEFEYALEHQFFHNPNFDWSFKNYKLKTGEEYDFEALDGTFPLESCRDQAALYMLKVEGFAETFHYGDQAEYGALMHQSVLIGAFGLRTKGWKFKELLALAQLRRNHISIALCQWNKGRFGLPTKKDSHISTRCDAAQYTFLGMRLTALLSAPYNWGEWVVPCEEEDAYQLYAQFDVEGFNDRYIPHDRIQLLHGEEAIVHHTKHHGSRQEIFNRVEAYFDASSKEENPESIVRRMGLVFYWICRGKFFDRGDPSIAEIVVRSYCAFRGIPLGSWKDEVVPWEEVVLNLDPEEFAEKFHTLFTSV